MIKEYCKKYNRRIERMCLSSYVEFFLGFGRLKTLKKSSTGVKIHVEDYMGTAQKWLKDRKGRTLSEEDIVHYQSMIVAMSETIRIMKEIDIVYSGADNL